MITYYNIFKVTNPHYNSWKVLDCTQKECYIHNYEFQSQF